MLLGERVKLARLRRKLTISQVAERAGIESIVVLNIEGGSTNINIGTYTMVLHVLNLDGDVYQIAKDDLLGRKLQDIELLDNCI